jgi:hypothetical protein
MKKLLVALFSFALVTAQAQTADDIIQKFSANMGGLDAFNKITSVKMTGTVTAQGNDMPLTTQIINGKAMRTDVEVMGSSIANCYYNGKGWKINPFQGVTSPTEVSGNELNEFKTQSMLANQLMDYKARGHQVEMGGEQAIDNVKVFKIKLTNKDDGKVTTYFISIANYTLIKSVATREMMGQELEVETYYSDLKETGGVKFFMSRSQMVNGQEVQVIKFEKIELNVPIDEKMFEMPK